MVSDGDSKKSSHAVSKSTASASQQQEASKEAARARYQQEVSRMNMQEAKWTHEPTIHDKLPKHERPFPIEPFGHERERLPFKMSDADRARRKAWVHAQSLADHEPVRVPELERMIYNPLRRLYRAPTDRLFQALAPVLGERRVPLFRFVVPKLVMGWVGGCVLWYHIKYNTADWQEKRGFTLIQKRPILLPEEPKPAAYQKWDYSDKGFQSRTAHKGPEFAY